MWKKHNLLFFEILKIDPFRVIFVVFTLSYLITSVFARGHINLIGITVFGLFDWYQFAYHFKLKWLMLVDNIFIVTNHSCQMKMCQINLTVFLKFYFCMLCSFLLCIVWYYYSRPYILMDSQNIPFWNYELLAGAPRQATLLIQESIIHHTVVLSARWLAVGTLWVGSWRSDTWSSVLYCVEHITGLRFR